MLDAYPPDLQDFVQQKIASGEFKSADEFAVRAALIYRDMDLRQKELKLSVEQAIAEIDAGNAINLKNNVELHRFFDDIKRRGWKELGLTADGE